MSSYCTTYKKKIIFHDTGIGHPYNRRFKVVTKKNKDVKFGYHNKEEQEKIFDKVKKYIDENIDNLMDCDIKRCGMFNECMNKKGDQK